MRLEHGASSKTYFSLGWWWWVGEEVEGGIERGDVFIG
jgi:hypothetical protein